MKKLITLNVENFPKGRTMNTKRVITLTAVCLLLAVSAQADVISVNMDRWDVTELFDMNVDQMASTETAGLGGEDNWNAYDPAAGSWQGGTPVDNSGAAVGGGFTVTGSGGSDSWNTGGSNNRKMFGDFAGSASKTISGIPYANYSIIVYSKLYHNATQSFDIDGGTAQTVANNFPTAPGNPWEAPQDFDSAPPPWSNGVFSNGVHYTTFTGLTASSTTLNHDAMAGFQIVSTGPTPTPGTLMLVK